MKLKAIASMCKRSKQIMLVDIGVDNQCCVQWVGDGTAMYPLYGMPHLEEDQIYTLFDVPEKDVGKMMFNSFRTDDDECIGLNFADTDNEEHELEQIGLSLVVGSGIVRPYRTSNGGVLFLDTAALTPINDALDYLTMHERTTRAGQTYVAVKNGLLLQGIIMPMKIEKRQLMNRLLELCDMVRTNIEQENYMSGSDDQMAFEDKD